MKRIFTLILSSFCLSAFSQSTTVVISQFYGGGGSSSSTVTYMNDYAELHNVSNVSQDISGFSLQYGSATGNFGASSTQIFTFPANTVLPAGKYYLVQLGSAGTGGAALPVTPDASSTNISASSASGKVALVNNSTGLGCGATATPCTLPGSTTIIDVISYGAANNAEGNAPANGGTALSSNQMGLVRKNSGCQDTDNNNNDFDVITDPVPRNSASTAVLCSSLPVKLSSFTASLSTSVAKLQWQTNSESSLLGYSVEKSLNGTNYNEMAFVNANNRPSNSYSVSDNEVVAGANYYRLKMIDIDGKFSYSNVVVLSNKTTIKAEVFPNPVANSITVRHEKALGKANISVVTMDGRQVKNVAVEAGASQTSFSLAELVSGNYMIIYINNGTRTAVKFNKQ